MDNSFFIRADQQNVNIERFHICTWEFSDSSSLVEFGVEVDTRKLSVKNKLRLELYIPWYEDGAVATDYYPKLKNTENSRFIFNDSVSNTSNFDGGKNIQGVVHEFVGRDKLCILPADIQSDFSNQKLILDLDLDDFNNSGFSDTNIYVRIGVEPKSDTISIKKKGIGKSTIIYDLKVNEERNIPSFLLADFKKSFPCIIDTCFCFHIIPNDYNITFFESEYLKSVRTLEFEPFKNYLDDKRLKRDDLIAIFSKKSKRESYSFFSIYTKERIGASQFATAILINIICGFLFAFPSIRQSLPNDGSFLEALKSPPTEFYLASALAMLMVLYFFYASNYTVDQRRTCWYEIENKQKMRILLDTNILIHREASRVINQDIGALFNWLDRLHFEKCVHPLSIDEISTHQDEQVVETMKIKIANYQLLKTESADTQEIRVLRQNDLSRNDFIDTSLIKEVLNSRVDFLITEDRGIHRKANILSISEKVFTIDAFLEKVIAENPNLREYTVLAAKKEFFGNINISDPFFDSFKEDYDEFQSWFNSKSDQESYVCVTDDQVKAFLYIKVEGPEENYSNMLPILPVKRRLKIGTFKVTSTGYKLGERFLKIIFDNALQYKVEEIYVTLFNKRPEQDRLIKLLEDWGFIYWGEKATANGSEKVYVRDFSPQVNLLEPKISFPFISKSRPVYIVPIYPEYHTELFPDSILSNESPANFTENEPYRNAIQKVYISRSYNRDLHSGDLIVFYRTGGTHRGVISTIGVVEKAIHNIQNESHFIELCRKRSVFDDSGLKKFWNYNPSNRPFIVNFLYIDSFPTPKVNLRSLLDLSLIESAPRGFERVPKSNFATMLNLARAGENYIID